MKVWPWRESVNTTLKVQAQFYSRVHIISSWLHFLPLSNLPYILLFCFALGQCHFQVALLWWQQVLLCPHAYVF